MHAHDTTETLLCGYAPLALVLRTQAAGSLSEMIEFQAQEGGLSIGTGDRGGVGGTLRVSAGRGYAAREQFFILYGRYSNAKLLYRRELFGGRKLIYLLARA